MTFLFLMYSILKLLTAQRHEEGHVNYTILNFVFRIFIYSSQTKWSPNGCTVTHSS